MTYLPHLRTDLAIGLGIDPPLTQIADNTVTQKQFKNLCIVISSAVTAYGRIHMNRQKLYVLNDLKGKISYTDTDSLVTNVKLPDILVNKSLGKFKLEHIIDKAYFITNKTYALLTVEGKTIIVTKGVSHVSQTKGFKFNSVIIIKNLIFKKCNVTQCYR